MQTEKKLLSFREAAALTGGMSESTLRRLDRAGAMPGVVIHIAGSRAYVRRNAFVAWLESEPATEPTPEPLRKISSGR